jgi:hypothetical protein
MAVLAAVRAGDICYGDVYVQEAHEPLISRQT